jgi:hypothetical protein
MTEGALAHCYRGAKIAPTGEVVDRSGDTASRRLSSKRPGVASRQPNYRYRGYDKNRDFPSHKPFLLFLQCDYECPFLPKMFLTCLCCAHHPTRKSHAVLDTLNMCQLFDKNPQRIKHAVSFGSQNMSLIDTLKQRG